MNGLGSSSWPRGRRNQTWWEQRMARASRDAAGARRRQPTGRSRQIIRLQSAEASTARLVQELPRARWAHIATHGFFADPSIRSVLTPDPKLFTQIGRERVGAGLRNPLVLSGLVLAGANLPVSDDPLAHDERGILTAEAIVGLDLSGMDWLCSRPARRD